MRTVSSPRKSSGTGSKSSDLNSVSDSSKSSKAKPALSNASLTRKLAKYYIEVCETRVALARVFKELDLIEKLFKESERERKEGQKVIDRLLSFFESQERTLTRVRTSVQPVATRPLLITQGLRLPAPSGCTQKPTLGLPPLSAKGFGRK